MAVDTDFVSVSTLLHFDGTDASTTITDNAPAPKTFATSGAAALTTSKSKFGGASLDLSTGGYVQCDASSDFAFGTGDFTIEFWAWKSANGAGDYDTACTTDTVDGSATYGWFVELSSTRGFLLVANGAPVISSSLNPNDSAWHHWAITRASGVCRLFKDGVELASATYASGIPANGPFGAGGSVYSTSYRFKGYIDDLRITKGVARYTAGFTAPTEAFPGAVVYALSGTVRDATDALAARKVAAYREDTNALVGTTTSDAMTGAYSITAADTTAHTLVFYPASVESLNALVRRGVLPIES